MSAPPRAARITSIDVIRGIVMILMAIDHVRVYSGVPTSDGTPGVFFTRWVTHFSAPAFAFFAGTSAFLYGKKLGDDSALAKHLTQRGLILIALELTYLHVTWTFSFIFSTLLAGVLWMLGSSMIILAACVRSSPARVGIAGVVIMALQTAMRPLATALPALKPLWQFLYLGGYVKVGVIGVVVLYNLIPWVGVMMAGYGFGAIMLRDPVTRDRLCLRIGLAAMTIYLIVGVILAANNGPDGAPFIFRLLGQSKYRDSQLFLLMTLGPTIALLPAAERLRGWSARALTTFGRVPMFYYLLHIPLIHAMALIVWMLRDGTAHAAWFTGAPGVDLPPDHRWSLTLLYAVFAATIVILYPVCGWYARFKAAHARSLLRYF
jgi:uncharacterized membrane protein